ncbi:sigma-54-dependent transcriptional regulator [Aquisediminimonas sediminicola]|uniref:sigma-54-dependent transcriptional regulator n=1 Tax=Alteraquisediminimonas sediminicola TaxID=2676787 RepID=UPI001C8E62F3|nr:sigma-54 dependent transcriptional regulator [Aquisediminimonas sediminicola]
MRQRDAQGLLLINHDPALGRLVSNMVAQMGWQLCEAANGDAALWALNAPKGPKMRAALIDDQQDIARLRATYPDLPIIMMLADHNAADAAIRAGATDYLRKPISQPQLLHALQLATVADVLQGELRPFSEKHSPALGFEEIVGATPGFRTALAIAAKAARARIPVLIEGERGVGTHAFAHAIHGASSRAKRDMAIVNCAAIPENRIASELFGHERGAFTGAFDRHIGRFAEADGSTILLDDVGALPLPAQVRLLHLLQTGEVQPLGAQRSKIVDVRIIATTNRNLATEVEAGRFREDLYYRLNAVQLLIPPLRDRLDDIPHLAQHFLKRMAGQRTLNIDDAALRLLMRYDWPGNVRQLHDVLFRAAARCDDNVLTMFDFPQISARITRQPVASLPMMPAQRAHLTALTAPAPVALFDGAGHIRTLDEIEADVIRLAIGHYRGRMTEVARRLGIGRSTLYRKLAELGISEVA